MESMFLNVEHRQSLEIELHRTKFRTRKASLTVFLNNREAKADVLQIDDEDMKEVLIEAMDNVLKKDSPYDSASCADLWKFGRSPREAEVQNDSYVQEEDRESELAMRADKSLTLRLKLAACGQSVLALAVLDTAWKFTFFEQANELSGPEHFGHLEETGEIDRRIAKLMQKHDAEKKEILRNAAAIELEHVESEQRKRVCDVLAEVWVEFRPPMGFTGTA
ncbi:hypothetical protein FVE85_4785 [Porphyridium purpureum]|uniref:Uncharacterized protein n=1 Tax=Porphyridium purpureum TaxID=35688 RepID=A0A5J4YQP7_PORPP|nr:hypothetical protein FVE85_4785 [Porphyridium purpureum]|eukprot:POR0576..scf236_6